LIVQQGTGLLLGTGRGFTAVGVPAPSTIADKRVAGVGTPTPDLQKAKVLKPLDCQRKDKRMTPRGILLDVDGTLVDSNDCHAFAWVRALGESGTDVSLRDCVP
jgi:hypothetical protein